jgi:glycosyltransferase involved in cell wall biosynthesis
VLVRAINRLPGLRLDRHPNARVAVCWNSEFLRATVPVPPSLDVVHSEIVYPINAAADEMSSVDRQPRADPPIVLYVGRLSAEKGVDVAIRALAALRREHGMAAVLRVVGEGTASDRRVLEAVAEEEDLTDQVVLVGPLRGAALQAEASRASAWVIPSVWDEPAPMVAVEAGLARVPVVASRVGGIPELLREPAEALLFERGDVSGCAAALAATLGGGTQVEDRVRNAERRAYELSFQPYLKRMDAFLQQATDALNISSTC